jgi:hypothetical protein
MSDEFNWYLARCSEWMVLRDVAYIATTMPISTTQGLTFETSFLNGFYQLKYSNIIGYRNGWEVKTAGNKFRHRSVRWHPLLPASNAVHAAIQSFRQHINYVYVVDNTN